MKKKNSATLKVVEFLFLKWNPLDNVQLNIPSDRKYRRLIISSKITRGYIFLFDFFRLSSVTPLMVNFQKSNKFINDHLFFDNAFFDLILRQTYF